MAKMSSARKLAIIRRADPVAEMASEVREGLETLARAVCALAVERHAKDPGHHRELAAVLFLDCVSDYRDLKIRPEIRDWMAKLLNIDPRNTQKFHR
jgi:hypothetical protein